MRKKYKQFIEHATGRTGYCVADVTYEAEEHEQELRGKSRATLNAAINDGKRFYNNNASADVDIYANATLTQYYDGGEQKFRPIYECVRVGYIRNGEYVPSLERAEWL